MKHSLSHDLPRSYLKIGAGRHSAADRDAGDEVTRAVLSAGRFSN
jgi:hypothetical protein